LVLLVGSTGLRNPVAPVAPDTPSPEPPSGATLSDVPKVQDLIDWRAMNSNVSGVAERDEDILTFDIPDDALERVARAAPLTLHFPLARLHLATIEKPWHPHSYAPN